MAERSVELTGPATNDIEAALEWYDARSTRLGNEFLERLDAMLGRIAQQPFMYSEVDLGVRRGCRRSLTSVVFDPLIVHQVLYPALSAISVDSGVTGIDCMERTELRGRGLQQLLSFVRMWRFEFDGALAEFELMNPRTGERFMRSREEILRALDSLERLLRATEMVICEGYGPCLWDENANQHAPHSLCELPSHWDDLTSSLRSFPVMPPE